RPLVVHRGANPIRGATASTTPVAGGPGFVIAVDSGDSIHDTNWADQGQVLIDLQWFADQYYAVQPDNVQFLIAFTTWRNNSLGAFYHPMANDVHGLGYAHAYGFESFDNDPGS